MLLQTFSLVLLTSASYSKQIVIEAPTASKPISEDTDLLMTDLIKKHGYSSEVHRVVSPDGYVLELHRIPHGKNESEQSQYRPAVYLQNGILTSSADWVITGEDKALAYILADAGYDVWMGNVRGTKYSRKHVTLDADKDAEKFWDFSWDEIGVKDVPTMIDYVLDTVKQEKIFYIGHSQGTTVYYVMCSERPEYNDKFRAVFSLAPLAWMAHTSSPLLRAIATEKGGTQKLSQLIGSNEFLPQREFLYKHKEASCSNDIIPCTNTLFAMTGFNQNHINADLVPTLMVHVPAGASTKQFLHYAQSINSGDFRRWNYGIFGNMLNYRQIQAPQYQLKKCKAPVYLYYSQNDSLSNERDVLKLEKNLGNVKDKYLTKFQHVDYLYGVDAPRLGYSILSLMKQH